MGTALSSTLVSSLIQQFSSRCPHSVGLYLEDNREQELEDVTVGSHNLGGDRALTLLKMTQATAPTTLQPSKLSGAQRLEVFAESAYYRRQRRRLNAIESSINSESNSDLCRSHELEFCYEILLPLSNSSATATLCCFLVSLPTTSITGLPDLIARCPSAILTSAKLAVGSHSQCFSSGLSVNAWHVQQRLVPTFLQGMAPSITGFVSLKSQVDYALTH